jgi:hypothetical protein
MNAKKDLRELGGLKRSKKMGFVVVLDKVSPTPSFKSLQL